MTTNTVYQAHEDWLSLGPRYDGAVDRCCLLHGDARRAGRRDRASVHPQELRRWTLRTLQWTVSAYTITFGAGILTAAALGDRLGRRRVYVVGLALFTAASAACAFAPDANVLIAFRAIQGRRCRHRDAPEPHDPDLRLPGREAGRRRRHLGRHRRAGGGQRGRSIGGGITQALQLALDLLGQRPDRRRRNGRRIALRCRRATGPGRGSTFPHWSSSPRAWPSSSGASSRVGRMAGAPVQNLVSGCSSALALLGGFVLVGGAGHPSP